MSYLEEKYGNVEDDSEIDFSKSPKTKGKKAAKRSGKMPATIPAKRQKKK